MLAHGKRDIAALILGKIRIGENDLTRICGLQEEVGYCRGQCAIGEVAEGLCNFVQRPVPGDIGNAGQKRDAPARNAKLAHQQVPVADLGELILHADDKASETGVGTLLQNVPQERQVAQGAMGQKRAMAEHKANEFKKSLIRCRGLHPGP